ncbi:MAG: hypothetical protein ACNA7U_06595 [Candidatus Izemoplasmataceae bacterium]|jgi:hypothetical protein
MDYTCEVMINARLEVVLNALLDHQIMLKWQKELSRIVPVEQEENSFLLIFKVGDEELAMKESIKEENLPESITYLYEVPGALKEDANYFIAENNQTLWIVDVALSFDQPNNIPKEAFNQKTERDMLRFKQFIEANC